MVCWCDGGGALRVGRAVSRLTVYSAPQIEISREMIQFDAQKLNFHKIHVFVWHLRIKITKVEVLSLCCARDMFGYACLSGHEGGIGFRNGAETCKC